MNADRILAATLLAGAAGVLGVASAFAQTGAAPDMSQLRTPIGPAPFVPDTRANEPVAPNRNAASRPSDAPIPGNAAPAATYPAVPQPTPPATPYFAPGANTTALRGFFPPQPAGDLSLTHMGEASAAAGTPAQPVAITPQEQYVELQSRVAAQRYAEQQADRAERDNLAAQQRRAMQPAPINGAFTGLTDERNR